MGTKVSKPFETNRGSALINIMVTSHRSASWGQMQLCENSASTSNVRRASEAGRPRASSSAIALQKYLQTTSRRRISSYGTLRRTSVDHEATRAVEKTRVATSALVELPPSKARCSQDLKPIELRCFYWTSLPNLVFPRLFAALSNVQSSLCTCYTASGAG